MLWDNLATGAIFFFPLWARAFVFFQFCPLLSASFIPTRVRVVLALIVAWWFTPYFQTLGIYNRLFLGVWIVYIVGEALIGLLQAFIVTAFYTVLQMASHFFSYQMGLTMAQLSDPTTDLETPVVGQLLTVMAIWVFFSSDSLFYLFWIGIRESIEQVNIFGLLQLKSTGFRDLLIGLISEVFAKSFLISLPVLGVLFVVNFVTGLLSKVAPQINLLVMIFPICIVLGLYVIMRGLPSLVLTYSVVLESAFGVFRQLLILLAQDLHA